METSSATSSSSSSSSTSATNTNTSITSDTIAPQPITAPPEWKPLADYLSTRAPSLTLQGIRFWKAEQDALPFLSPVQPDNKPIVKSFDNTLEFSGMVGGMVCSYARLKRIFGEPHSGVSADNKCSVEWSFLFEMPAFDKIMKYVDIKDVQPAYLMPGRDKTVRNAPFGVLNIYDYKVGKAYCGEEGTEVDEIMCWHIGGHGAQADFILAMIRATVGHGGLGAALKVMNVMDTYEFESNAMRGR